MKKFTIAIMGSGFTKKELHTALKTIANDINRLGDDEITSYNSLEILGLNTEITDEAGILNLELRQLFESGEVKNTYFNGEGKASSEPERWEIYGDEGERYYYDLKSEYIHDCTVLGINTNL